MPPPQITDATKRSLSTAAIRAAATTISNVAFRVDGALYVLTAAVLLILDGVLTFGHIIPRVPYTEIDWSTYMQQVEAWTGNKTWRGTADYARIDGDTGPCVYPAGHLWAFRLLHAITGKDIARAQLVFGIFYLLNQALVYRLYWATRRMPLFLLVWLALSKRLHSIFVLRLFNDPLAMLLFYGSANLFVGRRWLTGCLLYSLAVSVKMNVLLFAPALAALLALNLGVWDALYHIAVCAMVQLTVALPFLVADPRAYLLRAFDLGRVFLYKWTVNWRFVPEWLFLSPALHKALLVVHVLLLIAVAQAVWFRTHGGLRASLVELAHGIRTRTGVSETLLALFSANLCGICVARSLHYQFYSWYFHQLPLLLFVSDWHDQPKQYSSLKGGAAAETRSSPTRRAISVIWRLFLLGAIEWSWNVYPSTVASSAVLSIAHLIVLVRLFVKRAPLPSGSASSSSGAGDKKRR